MKELSEHRKKYLKEYREKKQGKNSFDKETHPSVVNNLNNLQPLWAKDNFSKGKKIL
jgi:hypothetical protein